MVSQFNKEQFKDYLKKFTGVFQDTPKPEDLKALKAEINDKEKFNRDDIIECWMMIFNAQGPVEKVSENKYEIYDVSNFMGESSGSSSDYIHTVEFTGSDENSLVFMKFYFAFYCLVNGVRSNEYDINNLMGNLK